MSKLLAPNHGPLKKACIDSLRSVSWNNTEIYGDYLAQTYYYVNHSERLLALAAALFSNEDRPLMRRFFKHLKEESAHDQLLIKDIESLGFLIKDFPERAETKMFWETQYYKIEHEDPAALLGYIYFLEDLACDICPELTKLLTPLYGKTAVRFLKLHGEEDPDHVEKAYQQILKLHPDRQRAIAQNYEQSARAYCLMISAIATEKTRLKSA
ncbi:MAG TPA: iron-containing redox enzyme family protein [Bacteriovoracaceae bacterium]|nr:iron-containing redox enzyme family protein [Bacteriovoracaceae bacterium]